MPADPLALANRIALRSFAMSTSTCLPGSRLTELIAGRPFLLSCASSPALIVAGSEESMATIASVIDCAVFTSHAIHSKRSSG